MARIMVLCGRVHNCLSSGQLLDAVPPLIQELLTPEGKETWREARTYEGNPIETWIEFRSTDSPHGLGVKDPAVLFKVCAGTEAERLLRNAERRLNQHDVPGNNVTKQSVSGNSRSYTLDRLHRQHPELYERVMAGELSANAAAIEAGFRKRPAPQSELRKWWRKATDEERDKFMNWVRNGREP